MKFSHSPARSSHAMAVDDEVASLLSSSTTSLSDRTDRGSEQPAYEKCAEQPQTTPVTLVRNCLLSDLDHMARHHYIKHPSLKLECSSLMPTLTRLKLRASALPAAPFPLPWTLSQEKTSTIHSYHTLRLSVLRHIFVTIVALLGICNGVCSPISQ